MIFVWIGLFLMVLKCGFYHVGFKWFAVLVALVRVEKQDVNSVNE